MQSYYRNDNDMNFTVRAVDCRGRKNGAITNVQEKFEDWQLDALAPLTAVQQAILSKNQSPPAAVQLYVDARMAAVQLLKFGCVPSMETD